MKQETHDDFWYLFNDQPKSQYLNFKEIEFVWHGSWPDPELIYKNKHLNYWDVEDYFDRLYRDDMFFTGHDFDEFGNCIGGITYEKWCERNEDFCYEMLDEILDDLCEYGKRG